MEFHFDIVEIKETQENHDKNECFLKIYAKNPISKLLHQTKSFILESNINLSEHFSIILPIFTDFNIEIWNSSLDKGKIIADTFTISNFSNFDTQISLDSENRKYQITLKISKPIIAEKIITENFKSNHSSNVLVSVFSKNELDLSVFHSSSKDRILEVSNQYCNRLRKSTWNKNQVESIFVYSFSLDLRNIFNVWDSLFISLFSSLEVDQHFSILITEVISYLQTKTFSYIYFSHDLILTPKTLYFPISLSFIPQNENKGGNIDIYKRGIKYSIENSQLLYENMEEIKEALHFPPNFQTNTISSNPFFTLTNEEVMVSINLSSQNIIFSLSAADEKRTIIKETCYENHPRLYSDSIRFFKDTKSILHQQFFKINLEKLPPKINLMAFSILSSRKTPISEYSDPTLYFFYDKKIITYCIPSYDSPAIIIGYLIKTDLKWKFIFQPSPSQATLPFHLYKDIPLLNKYQKNYEDEEV